MAKYIDRYSLFRFNNEMKPNPGIILPNSPSDLTYVYKIGVGRLDKISNMFYNNPWGGWLIMLANPEFGGLEFNIPDMSLIKIPYPFDDAVDRYLEAIKNHKILYGE